MEVKREEGDVDVLFVQRSAVNGYPPILNQAAILDEAGCSVAIFDGAHHKKDPLPENDVKLFRPLVEGGSRFGSGGGVWAHASFVGSVCEYMWDGRPQVTVLFESDAIALLPVLHGKKLIGAHFHEYPEHLEEEGGECRRRLARRFARKADLLMLPDKHRARALRLELGLDRRPEVVMNCPRKQMTLPDGRLEQIVPAAREEWSGVVLFQGSISSTYYLEEVVRSMRWWPDEAGLVCIGPDRAGMGQRLEALASEHGYLDRLRILPPVPYRELFPLTVDADLAVTPVRPKTFNFKYIAGASNKRFEAMACGVPQITNPGPGVSELVEETGAGVCQDPEDVEEFGQVVGRLLEDSERRQAMAGAAREVHLRRFNYETQYSSIRERILGVL